MGRRGRGVLCGFGLHTAGNPNPTTPSASAAEAWARPKSGTTLTQIVTGTLPQ